MESFLFVVEPDLVVSISSLQPLISKNNARLHFIMTLVLNREMDRRVSWWNLNRICLRSFCAASQGCTWWVFRHLIWSGLVVLLFTHRAYACSTTGKVLLQSSFEFQYHITCKYDLLVYAGKRWQPLDSWCGSAKIKVHI